MKKSGILLTFITLMFVAVPAMAKVDRVPGPWELVAPSGIDFVCGGGTYRHTLNTVSNNDPSEGMFTGGSRGP